MKYYGRERLYEEISTKRYKISISGQNHEVVPVPKQGGTGTTIHNPFGTGTKTSGTGTTMQNVFGIGTTVSKSPDFYNFA